MQKRNFQTLRSRCITGALILLTLLLLGGVGVFFTAGLRNEHNREAQLITFKNLKVISDSIQQNVHLIESMVNGLAAYIALNPENSQADFNQYLESAFPARPPAIAISFERNFQDNPQLLGFNDRLTNNRQSLIRLIETNGTDERITWYRGVFSQQGDLAGVVSASIPKAVLFQSFSHLATEWALKVKLDNKDVNNMFENFAWGEESLFTSKDSLILNLDIDGETWQVAARPAGEWQNIQSSTSLIWAIVAEVFLLINLFIIHVRRQKSREEKIHERLRDKAIYDQLTGLPNRFLCENRLEQAVGKAHRGDLKLAVLFIDLDNFKPVNDKLGHQAGDDLLRQVAMRLNSRVREADTAARLGGDEFFVILENIKEVNDASIIAGDILKEITKPYYLGGHKVTCSASIGIAAFPNDGATASELVRNADKAMYLAKSDGKNNWKFFSKYLQTESEKRQHLHDRLVRALVHQQLEVHYQPIINLRDKSILNAEALVRWFEGGEQIDTRSFIQLAEETEIVSDIDRYVLQKAVAHMNDRSDKLNCQLGLHLNLSARFFSAGLDVQKKWLQIAIAAAAKLNITVEIGEMQLHQNSKELLTFLNVLKRYRIRVAIDNLGTGNVPLNQLLALPVDIIKIDKSITQKLGKDQNAAVFVETIIGVSRKKACKVVAEGVETLDQLMMLEQLGCDYAQGHYFFRPMGEEQYAQLLGNIGSSMAG